MTKHRRSWLLAIFAALVLPLLWAPAAHAISKIKIREVYSGTNDDSYVELEAFDYWGVAGETLPGKSLVLFDPVGNPTIRFTFVKGTTSAPTTRCSWSATPAWKKPSAEPRTSSTRTWKSTPPRARRAGTSATLRSTASPGAPLPARQNSRPTPKAKPATPRSRVESPPARRSDGRSPATAPPGSKIEDDTDDSATDFFEADPDPHTPGNWPEENGEAID